MILIAYFEALLLKLTKINTYYSYTSLFNKL